MWCCGPDQCSFFFFFFFCCSPLDVGDSSFAPADCTKLLLCSFCKNESQNKDNLFQKIFTVISKRSHKYSTWETDPAAQHLSCVVQFSTSQNNSRYSNTSSASFRYMLQADNIHFTEQITNKKIQIILLCLWQPTVFLLIYEERGWGRPYCIKKFPRGDGLIPQGTSEEEDRLNSALFLLCKADTPVFMAWLTFHTQRLQKSSCFVFKVSLKDSVYLYICQNKEMLPCTIFSYCD